MDPRAAGVWLSSVLGGLVVFLLLEGLMSRRRNRGNGQKRNGLNRGVVAATGTALAAFPFAPVPAVSVPISTVVSPAVAAGVICHILGVRREQSRLRDGSVPVTLSPSESDLLALLVRTAGNPSLWPGSAPLDLARVPDAVKGLVRAVEMTDNPGPAVIPSDWRVLVRLVGEPVVENPYGERATFGKRRALELFAWMVLNSDRSTRSAARNALWEGTVSDSTFSTILSDMRRALSRIAPLDDGATWSPHTYTDSLPVALGVTTDVDLLLSAAHTGDREELRDCLRLVRDMPFAGTSWLWPDLDGSTTRAVIAVMSAVNRMVLLASQAGDVGDLELALHAGLRVQPGDEHLLSLRQELLERIRPGANLPFESRRSLS
ncbi:MAG: hypothetical protein ACKOFF_04655 [Acidimicrobiales bacterium]